MSKLKLAVMAAALLLAVVAVAREGANGGRGRTAGDAPQCPVQPCADAQ